MFLLVVMIFPIVAMGQIKKIDVSEIKVTPPVFTGVQKVMVVPESSLNDPLEAFLAENFKYPGNAEICQQEGTAVVQFTVHPSRELSDFEVINSVCPTIDNEFIRVLKNTRGMWDPGYNDDTPTAMKAEVSMMCVAKYTAKKNPGDYFLKKAQKLTAKGSNLFLDKGKTKKALNYINKSVKYRPYETSSLLLRGLCRFELGDEKGACSDWNRINEIGKYDADLFQANLCELKGHEEMVQILNNQQK